MKSTFKEWQRQGRFRLLVSPATRFYRWGPLAWKDLKFLLGQRTMRRYLLETHTIDEWVEYIFSQHDQAFKPIQIRSEISGLLKILQERQPKRILEIGTANGGTLFLLCRVLAPDGAILSVDLPGGCFGGGYAPWRQWIYKTFTTPDQKMDLLRADSHLPETRERVEEWLNGDKFDFILIDGDHTYSGAKTDFEHYRGFLQEHGIVAFHDIVPHKWDAGVEVFRLWNEIRSKHNVVEFVESWDQCGAGIGLLLNPLDQTE
ncbi:MAG: class I SAM-dependent methyltransferase [Candidatus Hydrogenedentales bacterium]|jgi:predicted O-methyltransferase YrrM